MDEVETWRDIPNTDYSVSNLGRVSSRAGRGASRTGAPVGIMKTNPVNGYPTVLLWGGPKPKRMRVHRLVAMAFISEPPTPKHEVNHKDGDRSNSRVENLEWVTRSENQRHRFDVLGHRSPRGTERKGSKLNEDLVRGIRARRGSGATIRELAREFGVAHSAISNVWTGKTWGWLA